MENGNEHRIPLRNTNAYRNRRHTASRTSKTERSGFIIRLNICITIIAALLFLSKINSSAAQNITETIKTAISENQSLYDFKKRAAEVFANLSFSDNSDEVYSDLSPDITDEINREKELENSLKNK